MTRDELFDFAASVSSRNEFTKFVDYLKKDFIVHNDDWENKDINSFLSGLSSFSRDIDGYYKNMNEVIDVEIITWRMAAQILLASSVYEC